MGQSVSGTGAGFSLGKARPRAVGARMDTGVLKHQKFRHDHLQSKQIYKLQPLLICAAFIASASPFAAEACLAT